MSRIRFFSVLCLCSFAVAPPATAAPEGAADNPHARLYAILSSPEVEQRALDAANAEMRTQFAADPDIAALEEECPGTLDVMIGAANELSAADLGQSDEYGAKYLAVLRENLSPAEAAEAADFFASELGQRFLLSVSGSMDFSNAFASAMESEDGRVERDAVQRDQEAAARSGLLGLDAADQFEATLTINSSAWGKALERARPQLVALQHDLINAETSPEAEAVLEEKFGIALDEHLATCSLVELE